MCECEGEGEDMRVRVCECEGEGEDMSEGV